MEKSEKWIIWNVRIATGFQNHGVVNEMVVLNCVSLSLRLAKTLNIKTRLNKRDTCFELSDLTYA